MVEKYVLYHLHEEQYALDMNCRRLEHYILGKFYLFFRNTCCLINIDSWIIRDGELKHLNPEEPKRETDDTDVDGIYDKSSSLLLVQRR